MTFAARRLGSDAYVSWQGSCYSVPGNYAGKQVWVRERGRVVEVHYGCERIAVHGQAPRRLAVITDPEHHRDIPPGALVVEIRPLAPYESAAIGSARRRLLPRRIGTWQSYVCLPEAMGDAMDNGNEFSRTHCCARVLARSRTGVARCRFLGFGSVIYSQDPPSARKWSMACNAPTKAGVSSSELAPQG